MQNHTALQTAATWLACIAITVAMGAAAAHYDNQDAVDAQQRQDSAAATASRAFAERAVCGPRASAHWLDDKTLQCLPYTDSAIDVAAR